VRVEEDDDVDSHEAPRGSMTNAFSTDTDDENVFFLTKVISNFRLELLCSTKIKLKDFTAHSRSFSAHADPISGASRKIVRGKKAKSFPFVGLNSAGAKPPEERPSWNLLLKGR
jgi:hypothetical protein